MQRHCWLGLSKRIIRKIEFVAGINFESRELFLNSLRRDFPRELVPVVLSPLLYPNLDFDLQVDKMAEESTAMANPLVSTYNRHYLL